MAMIRRLFEAVIQTIAGVAIFFEKKPNYDFPVRNNGGGSSD